MTMDSPRKNSAKVVVRVSPIWAVSDATREFNSPTRLLEKNAIGKCTKWPYKSSLSAANARSVTITKITTRKKPATLWSANRPIIWAILPRKFSADEDISPPNNFGNNSEVPMVMIRKKKPTIHKTRCGRRYEKILRSWLKSFNDSGFRFLSAPSWLVFLLLLITAKLRRMAYLCASNYKQWREQKTLNRTTANQQKKSR